MKNLNTELVEYTCICTHDFDLHLCEDPGCPYTGKHPEACRYPECDCKDFLAVEDRFPSVKQAIMHIPGDLERHETVDTESRETSFSDIRAAYEDRYGKKWFSDLPRGLQRRWRNR